jgi:hypothetical protein
MIDRQTGSIWTHLEGKAIEGPMTGASLTMLPMPQMTWGDWQQSIPETFVLSDDTAYSGWYTPVQIAQYDRGEDLYGDNRLPANSLVVGVEENGAYLGHPIDVVQGAGGVVNDLLGEEPVVVFYNDESQTGLAYSRRLNGQVLEFFNGPSEGFDPRDRDTGSIWNAQGEAVSAAAGWVDSQLRAVVPFRVVRLVGLSFRDRDLPIRRLDRRTRTVVVRTSRRNC